MKKTLLTLTVALATSIANLNAQVTNGLVAKYSFNGGNANDEVGTNNGTVTGATLTTDRFGNANKAYSFDGINDKITFPDDTVFRMGQNNFTISVWAKFSATQFAPIVSKRNDSPSFDQYVVQAGYYGSPSNSFAFVYKPTPGGVGTPFRDFISTTQNSDWHHLVVVSKFSDSTYMFIDNTFVGSSNTVFSTNEHFNIPGAQLELGYTNVLGTDYYYNGLIDDIRIYSRALTTIEIDSLFNEPNPMTTGISNFFATLNTIGIYPNPTKNQVNFSVQTNAQLTNVAGQIVADRKNAITLDLSDQPTGIYFLILTDNKGQVIQRSKIVKE